MQLQRHLTPICTNYLVPLLVLAAFQLSSVLGLPALSSALDFSHVASGTGEITSAQKNSAELGKLTTGIVTGTPEGHAGSAAVPFGSPEKKVRFRFPEQNELASKPPPTKDDPAHTPPPTKEGPAIHPLTVIQPNPAAPVKVTSRLSEIPKNALEKLKTFFTSYFRRIFGRTGSDETVNQESGTFLSRLFGKSKKPPELIQSQELNGDHWKLTIHDGDSTATFSQIREGGINTLINSDKNLMNLFQRLVKPESFASKFKDAYTKFLATPTEELTPTQRLGYIHIMGYFLKDSVKTQHEAIDVESFTQHALLDMQAKFHAALDDLPRDSAQNLQELLRARFRTTKTDGDLAVFKDVPWDKDLFYYDQRFDFNNERLIKGYFKKNKKISEVINRLDGQLRETPPQIEGDLQKLSTWINKNNQEINSQQKTALFLLLAEMGYAPSKSASTYANLSPEARSAIQELLENMKTRQELMSHNSKRLDQISAQLKKIEAEEKEQAKLRSTQKGNNAHG